MVDLQNSPRAIYETDLILDRAGRGLGVTLSPVSVPPDGTDFAVDLTVTFPENGTYEILFSR